jgi:AmmeMemoRadiSam system protein A
MPKPSDEPSRKPSQNLTANPSAPSFPELSSDHRQTLLHIAHEAIASCLNMRPLTDTTPRPPELWEPRGVFTTLYLLRELPGHASGQLHRELRGCVGYAVPVAPLFRAVAETARSAAFEDSRFPPVTKQEALELKVSLSVLSRLFAIHPEAIEIGRHGLLISDGSHRGLLLPQVPGEHGWDRETFLEQTCRKASLPLDSWRKSATVEAFTAEVFSDFDFDFEGPA